MLSTFPSQLVEILQAVTSGLMDEDDKKSMDNILAKVNAKIEKIRSKKDSDSGEENPYVEDVELLDETVNESDSKEEVQ